MHPDLQKIMFMLLCLLLIAIAKPTPNHHGISDELRNVYQEIGLLKEENLNQNIEIALLKEMIIGPHEEDGKHYDKVSGNELSITNQLVFEEMVETRGKLRKRPARLLPARILFNRRNDTGPPRFYGPPTNCTELSKLGYTLNGFYLVKQRSSNSNLNDDATQLDAVYCAFRQPEGTFQPFKVEKRFTTQLLWIADNTSAVQQSTINYTEIKFEAFSPKNGYNWGENFGFLPFEIVLNLGNVIDHFGLFKAPQAGDYQFLFQCTLAAKDPNVKIDSLATKLETSFMFMKNGDVGEYINFTGLSVSMETIFELNPGDTINIYNTEFNFYKKAPVHRDIKVANYSFSGSLLQKD